MFAAIGLIVVVVVAASVGAGSKDNCYEAGLTDWYL